MTRKLKFKGKDVEEAIETAVEKMKVSREKLGITIESPGSDGIFGLCRKSAVISVSLKEETGEPVESPDSTDESKEIEDRDMGPSVQEDMTESAGSEAVVEKEGRSEVEETPKRIEKREAAGDVSLPPEIQEYLKADLEKILDLMDMSADIDIREEEKKTVLNISGEGEADIVADKGQLLDSLEYLLSRMAGRKYPQRLTFSLDAGGFRASRKKELEELALKLTEEVKETGKTRTISPLNPSERRIVHMLLQQDNTIRSRSVGNGFFKKILIYLPGKARKQQRK